MFNKTNHALFFQPVLGKLVRRPTKLDKRLVRELKALADPEDPYDTVTGTTMCASDFYEGETSIKNIFFITLH